MSEKSWLSKATKDFEEAMDSLGKWFDEQFKEEKPTDIPPQQEETYREQRYELLIKLWQDNAPIPWLWPHDEQFESWFSMAIPALFSILKKAQERNQIVVQPNTMQDRNLAEKDIGRILQQSYKETKVQLENHFEARLVVVVLELDRVRERLMKAEDILWGFAKDDKKVRPGWVQKEFEIWQKNDEGEYFYIWLARRWNEGKYD